MTRQNEQLTVRWRYHAGAGAVVWHLMFTENGDLIGQKRCAATRQALFFGIEPSTGTVFCDDYLLLDPRNVMPVGDSWFTGLESTRGELAYCYACQSQSPEHQGIWAVDFRAGRVVWQRSDVAFIANGDEGLLVVQTSLFNGFPERHFLLLDPFTGIQITKSALELAEVHAIREKALPEEVRQQIILPDVVTAGMVAQLILQGIALSARERCECMIHGSLTVIARHEQSALSGLWRSSLNVWQMGRLLYDDCMEVMAAKPCMNNVLIQGDKLYYIKEKEELVCIALA